ncbi:hypothetical protein WR25_08173 [Diploscapter pachys]|uniref:Uncharacterized protein n=1 Tax=Diploscapter pachys TaxID=2018661 RepID=A0A2A2KFF5_9BILA|nr:hypothetical protein WR25_08173 [Diploscapter pachys]
MISANKTVTDDDPFPGYNPHVPSLVDMVALAGAVFWAVFIAIFVISNFAAHPSEKIADEENFGEEIAQVRYFWTFENKPLMNQIVILLEIF